MSFLILFLDWPTLLIVDSKMKRAQLPTSLRSFVPADLS